MQNQARKRESEALANENSDTDPEVGPEDDTQSQEILWSLFMFTFLLVIISNQITSFPFITEHIHYSLLQVT